MVWNNLSFMDNTTSMAAVVEGVNSMADGWLVGALMITLFLVSFMVFYGRVGVAEIILGNGFVFTIVGLLFINMGLLPVWVLGVTISLAIFGVILISMGRN